MAGLEFIYHSGLRITQQVKGWNHAVKVEFDEQEIIRIAFCVHVYGPSIDFGGSMDELARFHFY